MGDRALEAMLAWVLRTLGALSRSQQLGLAFACILVVGWIDYATGYEVSFSIFYLIPITIATWFAGRRAGIVFAVLCAVSWYIADVVAGDLHATLWIRIWNSLVRLGFFAIHAVLLDAFHRHLMAERFLSRIDPLTGVFNPRAFAERLEYNLAEAARRNRVLTLSYVDLDHFKRINDTHGHQEGDRVLQLCGRYLRESSRGTDTVARLGGDEFAVLMPDTDVQGAETAITKFADLLSTLSHADGSPVTCSIGVISFRDIPASGDRMVQIADQLMYEVKAHGRQSAVFGIFENHHCRVVKRVEFATKA